MRLLSHASAAIVLSLSAASQRCAPSDSNGTVPAGYTVRQHLPLANGARLELLEDGRITSALRNGFSRGTPEDSCEVPLTSAWQMFCREIHDRPLHPARIRVISRNDIQVDDAALERPIAELAVFDSTTLGRPLYSLTVDLSADAGSYSGPYARLIDSRAERISWARATDAASHKPDEVRLSTTLKTGWKLAPKSKDGGNDILLVACRPDLNPQAKNDTVAFLLTYTRFTFANDAWTKYSRTVPGCWENDGEFPETSLFPADYGVVLPFSGSRTNRA